MAVFLLVSVVGIVVSKTVVFLSVVYEQVSHTVMVSGLLYNVVCLVSVEGCSGIKAVTEGSGSIVWSMLDAQ